jgi:glycosyltransferase involved in cell wall biosynthesis
MGGVDGHLPDGVSVVVPAYRSSATLVTLVDRVHDALPHVPHEIVIVDDGSPPETWTTIAKLAADDDRVLGLRLGRNAGQHSALLAGVRAARYSLCVTIDDDLQNPPEEIPTLLDALTEDLDVVYGTPHRIAQRRWRSASSVVTRSLMGSVLGADNAAQMTSFRAFRTRLREGFDADLGPAVSLDALLSWSTSAFGTVPVSHHDRAEGRSNYSLRRLVRFTIDSATGYSAAPLQLAMTIGVVTAGLGLLLLCWVIGRLIVSGSSAPGFPFLASLIIIFSGVQLLVLGIIGEYLARMHFRVMRKPTYVVAERTATFRTDDR